MTVQTPDYDLPRVAAAVARGESVDSKLTEEMAQITKDIAEDFSPANKHIFAQTIGYAVNELQQKSLDFFGPRADQKTVPYGAKAAFNVQLRGIVAQIQAKGATPSRSYVASRQVSVETEEIAARPTIQVGDLLTGRINMPNLVREANEAIDRIKLQKVQTVLHEAIAGGKYTTPFYAEGTGGVNAEALDKQIDYFAEFGPVFILGTRSALRQVASLSGGLLDATAKHFSDNMIDQMNANGHLGVYNGAELVAMQNAYIPGTTTPLLKTNWLYILPGGFSDDTRNLKLVHEGGIRSFEGTSDDDEALQLTIKTWFGASFITMDRLPTVGAYQIN